MDRSLTAGCILSLLVCAGCAGDGPLPETSTEDFDRIQREIFNVYCLSAGCHDSQTQSGALVLEPGSSYQLLVGEPPDNEAAKENGLLRVTPFDPEESFLLKKLTDPDPGEGVRMPRGLPSLSPDEIELIRAWIAEGAPAGSQPSATATPTPTPIVSTVSGAALLEEHV